MKISTEEIIVSVITKTDYRARLVIIILNNVPVAVFADYHRTRKLERRGHAVDGLFVSYAAFVVIIACGCLSLRERRKLSSVFLCRGEAETSPRDIK